MEAPTSPLPDQLVELIAQRFRVLGEPMRIKLLDCLRDESATVRELCERTDATQQNVSKHLGVLLAAGMVSRTKEGNYARYEIADPGVFSLCEQVCGGLRQRIDELDLIVPGEPKPMNARSPRAPDPPVTSARSEKR